MKKIFKTNFWAFLNHYDDKDFKFTIKYLTFLVTYIYFFKLISLKKEFLFKILASMRFCNHKKIRVFVNLVIHFF